MNDNNPWGSSGNNNNPWGGGGSNNNMDFEESIKKARDRFGKFKIGGPRNISIIIFVALLLWLATVFYRVDQMNKVLSFYLVNGIIKQLNLDFIISFQLPLVKLLLLK